MCKITALVKGGDRTDCNNYRPITVLPTISKILERDVHQQLYEFLSANKLLTPNQFCFRLKLSTVTALAHFADKILQSLDKGSLGTGSNRGERRKLSRPLKLALKLWIGLPHTLKVGIKLACTQTLFHFSFRSFRKHRRGCERSERARTSALPLCAGGQ